MQISGMAGPVEAIQALWADPARWPNIVDDFREVTTQDETWPESGRVVWASTPHGRGRVVERVVEWGPGRQVLDVEDERMRGTQTVEIDDEGATLTLEYHLKNANPAMKVVDALFVRRSVRDSLQRSLFRLAAERQGDATQ